MTLFSASVELSLAVIFGMAVKVYSSAFGRVDWAACGELENWRWMDPLSRLLEFLEEFLAGSASRLGRRS